MMRKGYPTERGPLPPGIKLDENVYVTMRDGVKIAVDVYRPEAEGRYPGNPVDVAIHKRDTAAATCVNALVLKPAPPTSLFPRDMSMSLPK